MFITNVASADGSGGLVNPEVPKTEEEIAARQEPSASNVDDTTSDDCG